MWNELSQVVGKTLRIASMAAMAIYWNRNYYVEFLDEIKTYLDKDEHILLVNNLHAMLISSEIVSVAWLWSILHISIVMPMRYLVAHTYKWAALNWGELQFVFMFKFDLVTIDLTCYFSSPYFRSHFFRTCA